MLENLSDYLSLIVIILIPATLITFFLLHKLKRRKARILANQDKYYREW